MNTKPKILIVDDREENLIALERLLADFDAVLIRAYSGNEALTALLENEFALILIDVEMPEMDGFETVEIMRQDKKNLYIPTIFISAIYSENYHLVKGVESGAVDFITKPFIPEVLKGKVRIFLEIYNQRKKLQRYAENFQINNKDLTNKNKLLAESEFELKKSNDDKNKLFSIIAHDLRNPFNSLMGYTDLISNNKENLTNDEREVILNGINNIAKQTYNLFETLLNWARIQLEKTDRDLAEFNLKEAVNNVINFIAPIACLKNVTVCNEIPSTLNLSADSNIISTIIRNLLTNSLKFCNAGDDIIISSKTNDKEIKIIIEDSGIGIEPEKLEVLFEVDKVHSERGTCNEKGTGMGLVLCKDLIQQCEGYISAESEPQKGSKFTITLPVKIPLNSIPHL